MHDHRDLMIGLAFRFGWKRGVEVGVGSGKLFRRFLSHGIDVIGVDLGAREDRRAEVQAIGGKVLWMPSVEAAGHVADGWADFIFIDAGHSYGAVKADITAWLPKVKAGGWFGGHDYHSAHPGVIQAVDEAFGDQVQVLQYAVWRAPC